MRRQQHFQRQPFTMSKATFTALDVYKILPKTNCGKCQLPSCLAFAGAIVAGRKKFRDCPDLDQAALAEFTARYQNPEQKEMNQAEFIDKLQSKMADLDLAAVAEVEGRRPSEARPLWSIVSARISFWTAGAI